MANGNSSIAQSLFTPGDPSTIMTPEEGRALTMSSRAEQQLEPLEKLLYEPGHSAGLDVAQKKIADINDKQSSFMPQLIATAAALTGNFGPAMQLQEQKRKTADVQKMLPAMNEISRMKALGKYSDAAQALEMLSTKMGARVPEMKDMFLQQQRDLSDKQTKLTAAQQGYKVLFPQINKESPNYAAWKSLGAALDAGTPGAMDLYKTLADDRLSIQNLGRETTSASGLTGNVSSQTRPVVYDDKDFANLGGQDVAIAHGLSVQDIQNVMNGIPVEGVDAAKASQIRDDWRAVQAINQEERLAGMIQAEPGIATQALELAGVRNTALKKYGPMMSPVMKQVQDRITQQKIAEARGVAAADIRAPAAAGATYYDPKTGEVHVAIAKDVAEAQGFRGIPTPQVETVQSLSRARKNLALVNKMFDATGVEGAGATGLIARAGVLVNRLTGLPTTSAEGASLRTLVAEAINLASNMKGIPSTEVQRLRELSVNEGASRKDTVDALNNLIKSIDEQLGQIVGKGNIPQTAPLTPELSPAMQQQREKYLRSPQAQQHLRNREQIQRLQESGEIPMGPQKPAPSGIIPGSGRKSGRQ